jgi:hypothetical protein
MPNESNFIPANVSFEDYKELVLKVEAHRAEKLVHLDDFLLLSKEDNTIILDTRSLLRYERRHIKGAIHLAFTDFTQDSLQEMIPDRNTKILIYCNNNFDNDEFDFPTKMMSPKRLRAFDHFIGQDKPILLALNIPTYINLYGYGYHNVYELSELVSVYDSRIAFGGSLAI